MLHSGALPAQGLQHKGEGRLEAGQTKHAAAERGPGQRWTETVCGPPLWPWEWGGLSALGLCSGGCQAGERVRPSPQDPSSNVKAINDMKEPLTAPDTIDQSTI